MEKWYELDEVFFEDTKPGVYEEPTRYWLVTRECKKRGRTGRVAVKCHVEELRGRNRDDLDAQLLAFIQRPDVRYQPPKSGGSDNGS